MSDSRLEQLQSELSRRQSLEQELANRQPSTGKRQLSPEEQKQRDYVLNLGFSTKDLVQDLGAGAMRGGQNIAALLGEGGNALAGAMTGGRAPQVDIRNAMGLGKEYPVDLGKMLASKKANPLAMGAGQFAPGMLAGGSTLAGQAVSNGLYGAAQAQPEQENALGILPNGRPGAAIEGGASVYALGKMLPLIANHLKSAVNFLSPGKTATNYLENLGGGKSIAENAQELSKRMGYGQQTVKEEALIPKREVMAESGNERLFPSQVKGEEVTKNTSSIFAEHPNDVTPEKLNQYQRAVKSYYKDGDIDALVEKGEDIFNHPGLSEKEISKLDEALIPEKPVKGEYLKIKNPDDNYSDLIQEAHDAYVKNPTFRNSDKLRSRLFKRINELTERQKAKTITDSQEIELRSLTKNRNSIIKDQENLISKFSPENQGKYGKFNKTWREGVRAYEDAGTTIKNLKNGHLKNITPDKITNAFSFPELKPELERVLSDIGPSGINNIIYNEVGKAANPKELLKLFDNLERNKGFSKYITPEMRAFRTRLQRQVTTKNALKGIVGTTGTLGGLGYVGHELTKG